MIEENAEKPEVGMGATVASGSDGYAYTIIWISPSGKTIRLQRDIAKRIDKNGMSETQEYEYTRDPNGTIIEARLRTQRGRLGWFVLKSRSSVGVGHRREHYDFCR
jgi:hypothetical protein